MIKYSRVLLKLSGEALSGKQGFGIDPDSLNYAVDQIATLHDAEVQTGVVVGAGNFCRGASVVSLPGMKRAKADYVGMMMTVGNAVFLQAGLRQRGLKVRVMSALHVKEVSEPYIQDRAIHHLEAGEIVIFAAGTGNPYFTTDTAAALRGCEIEAKALFAGKNKVKGVFSADPRIDKNAKFLPVLTYDQVIRRKLKVMDRTAFTICQEEGIPIIVYDFADKTALRRIIAGERVGTIIESKKS